MKTFNFLSIYGTIASLLLSFSTFSQSAFYGNSGATNQDKPFEHLVGLNIVAGVGLSSIEVGDGKTFPMSIVGLEYETLIGEKFSLGARITSGSFQDFIQKWDSSYGVHFRIRFAGKGTGVGLNTSFYPFSYGMDTPEKFYIGAGFDISSIDWKKSLEYEDSDLAFKNRVYLNELYFFTTFFSKLGWKSNISDRYYLDALVTFGIFGAPGKKLFDEDLKNAVGSGESSTFVFFYTPSIVIGMKF